MGPVRSRFQGVWNIMRFNRRLLGVAGLASASLALVAGLVDGPWAPWCGVASVAIAVQMVVSLLVSHHIYDRSGLYDFRWLETIATRDPGSIVAISAGFDETSPLLRACYPRSTVHVLDFYDARSHTEASLSIARNATPSAPGSLAVSSTALPVAAMSADLVFVIFAAHEIRDEDERIACFRELHRVLAPDGRVILVEHLRDLPNVIAYSLGALHFHSRATWSRAFAASGLEVEREVACTRFVSAFILKIPRTHGTPA